MIGCQVVNHGSLQLCPSVGDFLLFVKQYPEYGGKLLVALAFERGEKGGFMHRVKLRKPWWMSHNLHPWVLLNKGLRKQKSRKGALLLVMQPANR